MLLSVHQLNAHFSTSLNVEHQIEGCQSSDLATQRLIAARRNRSTGVSGAGGTSVFFWQYLGQSNGSEQQTHVALQIPLTCMRVSKRKAQLWQFSNLLFSTFWVRLRNSSEAAAEEDWYRSDPRGFSSTARESMFDSRMEARMTPNWSLRLLNTGAHISQPRPRAYDDINFTVIKPLYATPYYICLDF